MAPDVPEPVPVEPPLIEPPVPLEVPEEAGVSELMVPLCMVRSEVVDDVELLWANVAVLAPSIETRMAIGSFFMLPPNKCNQLNCFSKLQKVGVRPRSLRRFDFLVRDRAGSCGNY